MVTEALPLLFMMLVNLTSVGGETTKKELKCIHNETQYGGDNKIAVDN